MADMKLTFTDWRKWSLEQKISYLKGSGGGYNLKRKDISELDDDFREMKYPMKNHRMAMETIEAQEAEIKRLRSTVEFVKRWVQRVHDNETTLEEFYGVLRYDKPLKPQSKD